MDTEVSFDLTELQCETDLIVVGMDRHSDLDYDASPRDEARMDRAISWASQVANEMLSPASTSAPYRAPTPVDAGAAARDADQANRPASGSSLGFDADRMYILSWAAQVAAEEILSPASSPTPLSAPYQAPTPVDAGTAALDNDQATRPASRTVSGAAYQAPTPVDPAPPSTAVAVDRDQAHSSYRQPPHPPFSV